MSLPEFATGNLLPTVKTGHMCRKYMGPDVPDMLKFNNGLASGMFRDAVFVKDPRVAKEVLEEPTTKKPEKGYRVFRRLHGYVGGPDFLSFRSHTDPIYARTRTLAWKTMMEVTPPLILTNSTMDADSITLNKCS